MAEATVAKKPAEGWRGILESAGGAGAMLHGRSRERLVEWLEFYESQAAGAADRMAANVAALDAATAREMDARRLLEAMRAERDVLVDEVKGVRFRLAQYAEVSAAALHCREALKVTPWLGSALDSLTSGAGA